MVLQVSPLAVFWKDEGDCAPCAKQTTCTCTNSHLEEGRGECVQSMWNNINEERKQEFLFVMCFCWDLAPAPARPPKNNKEKKKHLFSWVSLQSSCCVATGQCFTTCNYFF